MQNQSFHNKYIFQNVQIADNFKQSLHTDMYDPRWKKISSQNNQTKEIVDFSNVHLQFNF